MFFCFILGQILLILVKYFYMLSVTKETAQHLGIKYGVKLIKEFLEVIRWYLVRRGEIKSKLDKMTLSRMRMQLITYRRLQSIIIIEEKGCKAGREVDLTEYTTTRPLAA